MEDHEAAIAGADADELEPGPAWQSLPFRRLAHQLAGSLADVDIPGWESSEAAERWVETLREADRFPFDPPTKL